MKRNFFVVLMLVLFSATMFVACNTKPSVTGKFEKETYYLSQYATIDFYDELSVKGTDKAKIEIFSSNDNVLSCENRNLFSAKDFGSAFIFAKYQNQTIAKAEVIVKQQFSSPENIKVDDNGRVSWDKSFVIINGERVYAHAYEVTYKLHDEDNTVKLEVNENAFVFDNVGSYDVSIKAISNRVDIDGSILKSQSLHYGVMAWADNFNVSVGEEFNQKATLKWDAVEGANYDLYINGIRVAQDLQTSFFTTDFSKFQEGQTLLVDIYVKDIEGKKNPSRTAYPVKMLQKAQLNYSYQEGSGMLTSNTIEKATSFLIKAKNVETEVEKLFKVENEKGTFLDNLEGFEKGIYGVELIALGGNKDGEFYISSKISNKIYVAKLEKPNVEVTFDGNEMVLNFEENDYNINYFISYGEKSEIYSTQNGLEHRIDLSSIEVGEYKLLIKALPTADESSQNGVKEFSLGEMASNIVVDSDYFSFDFYKLGKLGEIKHNLEAENSQFEFDKVPQANFYYIYINGSLAESSYIDLGNKILLSLSSPLSAYAPDGDEYNIEIACGIKIEEVEHSLRSVNQKTLKILPLVEPALEQQNGDFQWLGLEGIDCLYDYIIYKTDKDYLASGEPVLEENDISNTQISKTLDEGYYVIAITSKSVDFDQYLDSDFFSSVNVRRVNFKVTKDIEMPSAKFVQEGNVYKLNISTVAYASEYKIYVDGELDGNINLSEIKEKITYVFASDFAEEGNHEIKVVACGGKLYDPNIYLDSQEYVLNVTRLAAPEISVEDVITVFDEIVGHKLKVNLQNGSDYVAFTLNGELIEGEKYSLDMSDKTKFGTEFTLGMTMIANTEGNFISSHERVVEFNRIKAATSLKYSYGKLSWTNQDSNIESHQVSIILKNSNTSDYSKRFNIDAKGNEFDIQTKINDLCKNDGEFYSAYRQAEGIEIEFISYANSMKDGIYYLSSTKASTIYGGTTLPLNKLDKPVLTFNPSLKTLAWQVQEVGSLYEIYLDDILYQGGYSGGQYSFENALSQLARKRKITVKATHPSMLESELSSPIYVKQLAKPEKVAVAKSGEDYVASITFIDDTANIENVLVNGSNENVSFVPGESVASFKPSEFNDNRFSIVVKAKNEGEINYYIDSQAINFTLIDLASCEFVAAIEDSQITWTELAADMTGNNLNPLSYLVNVKSGSLNKTLSFKDKTSLTLDEIETLLGSKLGGDVSIKVMAAIDSPYNLNAINDTSIGYYGKTEEIAISTIKLAEIDDITVTVVENLSASTEIERKQGSVLEIAFADKWEDLSGISFNVKIGGGKDPVEMNLTAPYTNILYSFINKDGKYTLTLSNLILKNFDAGTIDVQIQVKKAQSISSEISQLSIRKFAQTKEAVVDGNGLLTILDEQTGGSYIVEITTADGDKFERKLTEEKTLNLVSEDLLLNKYGAYTIKILTYDENSIILPANDTFNFENGYKLKGIEKIEIDQLGRISFTIFMDDMEGVIFTARRGDVVKDFEVVQDKENENKFYISMLKLLQQFGATASIPASNETFEFAVRREESIKSNYQKLEFNYILDSLPQLLRVDEKDKDYIVFSYENDSIETIAFRVVFNAFQINEEEKTITKQDTEVFLAADEVAGYWAKDKEGKHSFFTKSEGAIPDDMGELSDYTFTKVYAICLNDVLAQVPYGDVNIEVARIGKDGDGAFYQYGSTVYDIYKLNAVSQNDNDISISNNFLRFSWTLEDVEKQYSEIRATSFIIEFVSEKTGEMALKVETTATNYDLRLAKLNTNINYQIFVTAISYENNILASNKSKQKIDTLQFDKPLGIEVKNGKVVFQEQKFRESKFFKDIEDFFGVEKPATPYYEVAKNSIYYTPYYVYAEFFRFYNVTLNLRRVNNDGETNEFYNVSMPGYYLFPDIEIEVKNTDYTNMLVEGQTTRSYFDLLANYQTKLAGNEYADAVNSMISYMLLSPRGLSDNAFLFDDFGRNIPAGEYILSLSQASYDKNIESDASEGVRIYVSPAPEVVLGTETVLSEDGSNKPSKENYMVYVSPAPTRVKVSDEAEEDGNIAYTEITALKYKLQLREKAEFDKNNLRAKTLDFIILYDEIGAKWSLMYGEQELADVVTSMDESIGGVPKFKLNMTLLRQEFDKLENKREGDEIKINTMYVADLLAYNQDNGFVVNGKSGRFNLRYLDLKGDSIHFIDGQFVVDTENSESIELYVRYKKRGSSMTSKMVRFENKRAVINLTEHGYYDYLVLSINGSYTSNTLNVESSTYEIKDIYKLSAPVLEIKNGGIAISYSPTNTSASEASGALKYFMGNDVSLSDEYSGDDKGFYYQSEFVGNQSVPLYIAGLLKANGDVLYNSELTASQYKAYLSGNSGEFKIGQTEEGEILNAEYKLEFVPSNIGMEVPDPDNAKATKKQRPVLSSAFTQVNARMLDRVDSVQIEKGNLQIESLEEMEGLEEGELLYEIKIEYYIKDNFNQNNYLLSREETIYSVRNAEETIQAVKGQIIDAAYSYYKFYVNIIAGKRAESASASTIKTIEGDIFHIDNGVKFASDGAFALKSMVASTNNYVSRAKTPTLAQNNVGVKNGAITFVIDRPSFIPSGDSVLDGENHEKIAQRLSVVAEYRSGGNDMQLELKGNYTFYTTTASNESEFIFASFALDDGQLNDANGTFTVKVYVYGEDSQGNNAIVSAPLVISDIYKLAKIQEKYYDVVLINGNTGIDFSKYFQNISIQDRKDLYKLVATVTTAEGDKEFVFTNNAYSMILEIPDDAISVSFQAQDAQSSTQLNLKKLLSSDREVLNTTNTSNEGLEISWNDRLKRFEWTWPEDNSNIYGYYVKVTVSGKEETAFVSENYYCPKNSNGTILENAFTIKARLINDEDNSLFIFSEEKVYEAKAFTYYLFASGNGSAESPYIINSDADFKNIALRNNEGAYFRLGSNITVDLNEFVTTENGKDKAWIDEFYAHLDGNGFKINLNLSKTVALDSPISFTVMTNKTFTSYSALFRAISYDAVVENLGINYQVNNEELDNSRIIYAPICALNYGTIRNVNVNQSVGNDKVPFNINLKGKGSANIVFVGGVTGVNYGKVQYCTNFSEFNYNMQQQLKLEFGYGGIALFNGIDTGERESKGEISNCRNRGDKEIRVSVNNTTVYMAGISLANVATISLCGNDANFKLSTTTSEIVPTGYYAGITITSINGTLEYLYNNGRMQTTSSRANFYKSGVAYQVVSGILNTLVETVSGQAIISSSQSNPIIKGKIYASNNSGSGVDSSEIQVDDITCKDGKVLKVRQTESGFTAYIQ